MFGGKQARDLQNKGSGRWLNRNKLTLALIFILIGTIGRLALLRYMNIEPVLALCLLAGIMLGAYYAVIVPVSIMVLSDWFIYYFDFFNVPSTIFTTSRIIGLSMFVITGFVFAGIIGLAVKKRVAFNIKGVAAVSLVGIIATLLFDAWTAFGFWFVAYRHFGYSLVHTFYMQIPFTVYHLISSIVFVPLFTSLFMFLSRYDLPIFRALKSPDATGAE